MKLDKVAIRHSPLSDRIYLCRFGARPNVALEKRHIEPEFMGALVAHMTHDAPKGSRKHIKLGDEWYEIQVKPCAAPGGEA